MAWKGLGPSFATPLLAILLAAPVALAGQEDDAPLAALAAQATAASRAGDGARLAEIAARSKDVDAGRGEAWAREALAMAHAAGDRSAERAALVALGENLNIQGRNDDAFAAYDRALELARAAGDDAEVAAALRKIGVSRYDRGELEKAVDAYQESLEASAAAGDRIGWAKTSANLGNVLYSLNKPAEAIEQQRNALAVFEELDLREGIAGVSLNLGANLAAMARDPAFAADEAQRIWKESLDASSRALEVFRELGVPRGEASARSNLGNALLALGQLDRAEATQREALRQRHEVGDQVGVANSLTGLGEIALARGELEAAEALLLEGREVAAASAARLELERIEWLLHEVAEKRGDWQAALDHYREHDRIIHEISYERTETRLREMEAHFEDLQRLRQIETLEQDKRLAQLALARATTIRHALLLSGGLTVGLLFVIWSRYRLALTTRAELERLARTDSLTGVANRRALTERLREELARARRHGRPLAIAIADIDHFKQFNDEHGHDVGDAALVEVAQRVRAQLRAGDSLGRWGGEELLVLLPETELDGALQVAERIRAAISERPLRIHGRDLPLGVTLGVASVVGTTAADDAIRRADTALLRGKREGKNRVVAAA